MERFPKDVLVFLFSFLPFKDWFSILCTCKRFRDVGIENFDASYDNNKPLIRSCILNRKKCVKQLLRNKFVDPSADRNFVLKWATNHNHWDIFEQVLKDKRVDPSVDENFVLHRVCDSRALEQMMML